MDILTGRVYPLKLGFIGIVNRSQADIQSGRPLADALQAERDFFKHHPAYRNMANRCGTQFLAKSLNQTLMSHIRDRLPDIKARLNTLMGQTQQELASYGDVAFTGKEHRGSLVLQLMTRFASSFISSIDGTSTEISTKELCGGARIYYIFNSVFGNSLEQVDPTQNLSVLDIRTAIRNSTGPRPSLFVPELAFDLLVKPQIKLLEIPSQRCVELVYEELIKICHTCGSTELTRYPRLQGKLIEVVSDLLREQLGPCSNYVASLIDIQRAYINTNHPNFLGAAAAMSSVIADKEAREKKAIQDSERKKREQKRLKELNGANGEAPEDGEDSQKVADKALPLRKHQSQTSRSMSPAVGRMLNGSQNSISGQLNNRNRSPTGNGRDGFLNYFFGKDGGAAHNPSLTLDNRPGSRHVSQHAEPSFAQSIRRGDPKAPSPMISTFNMDEDEEPNSPINEVQGGFVSAPPTCSMHPTNANSLRIPSRLLRSQNVRHSRRSSSAASSPRTSTLCARRLRIKCPRPSCTCWSTTPRTVYRTGLSARCTGKTCSRSCSTKTTRSRRSARSARSCSRRTRRQPRSSARFCKM